MSNIIEKLIPTIKHYAWGAIGDASLVASYANYSGNEPCAELWLGAHPSGESLTTSGLKLSDILAHKGETLPFLFKVLSIGSPLSIQLHPNLQRAKSLHADNPKEYPDENHKPEIAIAIDQLDLVAGVKSDSDFRETVNSYEGLSVFSGADSLLSALKILYSLNKENVSEIVSKLFTQISKEKSQGVEKYFLQAYALYDSFDPGLVILFFLNFRSLKSGEAVFTGPGIPHAYLSGNLIECMANSDNVVRGGLTRKFLDKDVFLELISSEDSKIISPVGESRLEYAIDGVKEFKVIKFLKGSFKEDCQKPGILLCTDLSLSINGTVLQAGEAVLVQGMGYSLDVVGEGFLATAG